MNISQEQLLEFFGNQDPTTKMLMQMMQQQEAQQDSSETEVAEMPRPSAHPRYRKLRKLANLLQQKNELLEELLDELSDALGTCPDCWGQDDDCHYCRGEGGSGFRASDEEAFNEWIAPLLTAGQKKSSTNSEG